MTAEQPHIFDQTIADYLTQARKLDWPDLARRVGVSMDNRDILLPFFQTVYHITPQALFDPQGKEAPMAVKVALLKYLLLFPPVAPKPRGWASFRDFADAAPFAGAYAANVEQAMAQDFTGKTRELALALEKLGGRQPEEDYPYDVAFVVPALPHMNLLALFNDAEEGFPASASVLFDQTAMELLDPECLAITGWALADRAAVLAGLRGPSLDP